MTISILLSECLYKVIGCDASGWECLCVVFDYKQSDFQIPLGPMFINKIQAGYKKESNSKDSFESRLKLCIHSCYILIMLLIILSWVFTRKVQ